ncbi:MAG: hypothetical protein IKR17_04770 [Bacteroidales bacterium]|nr:hypothetical protein [Bacteroidales bacterium]
MAKKYDFNPVTGKIDMTSDAVSALTPAQRAAIEQMIIFLNDEKQKAAQKLYKVSTNVKNNEYEVDEADNTTMRVVVTTMFDGKKVDSEAPKGWTRTDVGTYYRELVDGVDGDKIDASLFTYTVESGDYVGMPVSGWSSEGTIKAIYPAWYGWVSFDKTSADVNNVLENKTLTKVTKDYRLKQTFANNSNEAKHFWVITKGKGDLNQHGTGLLQEKSKELSITINGRTLNGYLVYKTIPSTSCASGYSYYDAELVITLK